MKIPVNLRRKRPLIVFIILRTLVVLTMIFQFIHGNYANVFTCILTLALFLIPSIVDRKFNIQLPNLLESIIYLFIFAAEILGEIQNFYGIIPHWDTMLHTINGFLMAAIGFAMIDILNQHQYFHFKMSPVFVAVVAFCFSMTIGVVWEFFEYGMDRFFQTDMQKDTIVQTVSTVTLHPEGKNTPIVLENVENTVINHNTDGTATATVVEGGYLDVGITDTMKDLWVNFIGAVAFYIIGYIYIVRRGKSKMIPNLVPTIKEDNNEQK